ncbi:MAG: ABC transporter permease, partial [Candidatus Omnitrophica bacterium]|nr:ABC transporter permease [Candidatus Omnitrophota bacterium]
MKQFRFYRNVELGVKNLLLRKLRSFLTLLGVVFGVGSVVAMLAVGEGASKEALEQIRKLGSNNIIITSEKPVDEESSSGGSSSFMSMYGLLYDDATRVEETFNTVRRTVPVKLIRKEGRLRRKMLELRVVGTTPDWFELVQRPLLAGRVLMPIDYSTKNNVVVLTEHGARRLLANENTIGQSLRLGTDYFEVVGIIKSEEGGGSSIQTPDRAVDAYIPLNVARERYGDTFTKRT